MSLTAPSPRSSPAAPPASARRRRASRRGVRVAILDMNRATWRSRRGRNRRASTARPTSPTTVGRAALARARAAHGDERILVNCAGIAPGKRTVTKKRDTGELVRARLGFFRKVIEINLVGTYRMIAKCAAAMAGLDRVTPDGGRGVVVCTASVAARRRADRPGRLCARRRGACVGLTLPVARDLRASASG